MHHDHEGQKIPGRASVEGERHVALSSLTAGQSSQNRYCAIALFCNALRFRPAGRRVLPCRRSVWPDCPMIGGIAGPSIRCRLHPTHARSLPARPPLSARGAAPVTAAPPDQTVFKPRRLFIGAKSRPLYNNVRPRSIQNVPMTRSIVFRIVILRRRGNGNSPQPWQPVSASIISPSTAPVSVVFRSLSAVQIPLIRECKFVDIWLSDSALKQLIYLYL